MDTLDSALAPLKPTLRRLTTSLPDQIDTHLLHLLGPQCHASLLQRLDLSTSNQHCTSLALSKTLGLAIITAASIVKIPQLIKLISSQSAAGLSFPAYALETLSFTITLAYSLRNNFPFSTFGETALIAIQDIAIGACILLFSGRSAGAAAFVAGVASVGYALFVPEVVGTGALRWLQAGSGVLGVASKVPQIWTVWREGGTGMLSAFAVFNYLAGSLSRIFTTLQEVDDPLILYGFVAGFVLNAVLAAQMVYYWNSPASKPPSGRPDASHQKVKLAVESGTGPAAGGSSPASKGKSKGPSTRRRG